TGITAMNGGYQHTCTRMTDSTLRCWGANESGQLGDNTQLDHLSPAAVIW
ncbi:MAG: repeat domain protein, partial [Labilithrix sp.]|nr:repeat domain protein [Labilithrix sp.]